VNFVRATSTVDRQEIPEIKGYRKREKKGKRERKNLTL